MPTGRTAGPTRRCAGGAWNSGPCATARSRSGTRRSMSGRRAAGRARRSSRRGASREVSMNGQTASTDAATRGDLDALTALNRDYIHSVQHGDVRRFEEILAEDFLCSNPDGSLVDRRGFLAQTAKPVTISALRAHDVLIRRFGDVALIHARTTYALPDGRQA